MKRTARLTPAIDSARTPEAMLEAFHPSKIGGRLAHGHDILDLVEGALMFALGKIGVDEFHQELVDNQQLVDAILDQS